MTLQAERYVGFWGLLIISFHVTGWMSEACIGLAALNLVSYEIHRRRERTA